jgi:flagellar biogenesis protein FliO
MNGVEPRMATDRAPARHVLVARLARRRSARARVAACAAAVAAAWSAHAAHAIQAVVERQPLGAPSAAPAAGTAADVVRLVGALVVVLALAFAVQWWFRRSGLAAKVQGGAFEVLARHPVGRGQSVLVARFGSRLLLLQQSRDGLRTLSEVADAAEASSMLSPPRAVAPHAPEGERTVDLRRRKDGAT